MSFTTGIEETELPGKISKLPDTVIECERFDGFLFTAERDAAVLRFRFAAVGRFLSKKAPKRVFAIPKRCAIGILPGCEVPEPAVRSKVPYNTRWLMYYVMNFMLVPFLDAIFIEPFSGYYPEMNESNFAQWSLLGCCKYYDFENKTIVGEVPMDAETEILDEYLFDDCAIRIHWKGGFGEDHWVEYPVKNGVAEISSLFFSNASEGTAVHFEFASLPPVGGELGERIREESRGTKTIRIGKVD